MELDLNDALKEVHRLRGVIGGILQTACDADEAEPMELINEIAKRCSLERWASEENYRIMGQRK